MFKVHYIRDEIKKKSFKVFTYKYTQACIPKTENTATSIKKREWFDANSQISKIFTADQKKREVLTKSNKSQTEHNSSNDNESQSSVKHSKT